MRSNFTPAVTIDPTKTDSDPLRSSILKILQPSIDINLPILGNKHYAPYGDPSGYGLVLIYAALLLAIYGLYRLIK